MSETSVSMLQEGAEPGGAAWVVLRLEVPGACASEGPQSFLSFEAGTAALAQALPAAFDADLVTQSDGVFVWSDRDLQMSTEPVEGGRKLVFVEMGAEHEVDCASEMGVLACSVATPM